MKPPNKPERYGYILRIAKDEWLRQVYQIKKYYPGFKRRWDEGTVILLAKKTEAGDSFIGYGIVERVMSLEELPTDEKAYCEEHGWKCAIVFKELYRFDPPYPIKESILKDDPRRGRYLHGARLPWDMVSSILESAKDYMGNR
jgi:hypothetical protein